MRNAVCEVARMESPAERLRAARRAAGFATASEAARSRGWTVSTYLGHENGDRVPSRESAKRYAKAFRVRWDWILEGDSSSTIASEMPISGKINRSSKVEFDHNLKGMTPVPPDGAGDVIALVAGSSVMPGVLEERWVVYCEKARRKPSDDDIGRASLIGLDGGDVFLGRLYRARGGRYDVVSLNFESTKDVSVDWISLVTWIRPG